ncbi:MAG: EAL domain-containing protein [Solirubrobacterales bacterium]
MGPGELETISWAARVRDAIDDRRIHFHAQPIVSLRSEPVSYELLCRIEGYDGKLIQPDNFMSAAENYGLIEELE